MPSSHQVGDRIGDGYEVFAVHRGGMSLVYEVEDRRRRFGERYVAVKTLAPELAGDALRRARFESECRLWVRLGRHPHVVAAFAVESIASAPHLILERMTGGDLAARVGDPSVDLPTCLRWGIEFCLGMEHAVRQGLRCHRDVKPGNLMIAADGSLRVTDFGIAGIRDEFANWEPDDLERPIELDSTSPPQPISYDDPRDRVSNPTPAIPIASRPEPPPATMPNRIDDTLEFEPRPGGRTEDSTAWGRGGSASLTSTGALLGTLPYMAPEQFVDAHRVDMRADIYGFGVVLYQLITKRLPFQADTIAKFARRHAVEAVPSVTPSIAKTHAREAPAIDAIVHKCLAKDPNDRPASFEQLRRKLEASLARLER
ncbi:MAG: protein kinase [Isosphaeraceae bacterium]|nr:protein kinase [Isosphaeraceae bacterium]